MLFIPFLFVLEENLLPHLLWWDKREKGLFKKLYLSKSNPKWDRSFLALYQILDAMDDEKYEEYMKDPKYDTNCKIRCRGNMNKFMSRPKPYFSYVKQYKHLGAVKQLGTVKEYKLNFLVSKIPSMLAKLSKEKKIKIRNMASDLMNLKTGGKVKKLPNPTSHYLCLSMKNQEICVPSTNVAERLHTSGFNGDQAISVLNLPIIGTEEQLQCAQRDSQQAPIAATLPGGFVSQAGDVILMAVIRAGNILLGVPTTMEIGDIICTAVIRAGRILLPGLIMSQERVSCNNNPDSSDGSHPFDLSGNHDSPTSSNSSSTEDSCNMEVTDSDLKFLDDLEVKENCNLNDVSMDIRDWLLKWPDDKGSLGENEPSYNLNGISMMDISDSFLKYHDDGGSLGENESSYNLSESDNRGEESFF